MIAYLGFASGTNAGTMINWDYDDCCVTFKEGTTEIDLIRLQNAIKATETMVDIGRGFVDYMKTVFRGRVLLMRRLLFCKSGYLPKRIRRKRRSK